MVENETNGSGRTYGHAFFRQAPLKMRITNSSQIAFMKSRDLLNKIILNCGHSGELSINN